MKITISAGGVDDAIHVHCRRIDAPFEAVRMGGPAAQGSIRIAAAALSIGIPELPLGHQARRELGDVIGTLWSYRTVHRAVAVRTRVVVVVLDHHRIGSAVRVSCRR